jgi:DNA polymerase-1
MEKYFDHYAGVRLYMGDVVERAKEDGYVTTLMGRRRWVPELKSGNFNTRSFGERVALNAPIQGTAADIIKLAMINVSRKLKESGIDARLILQVHDELLIEAHRSCADEALRILVEEMENTVSLKVPLSVEAHIGSTWYDAK